MNRAKTCQKIILTLLSPLLLLPLYSVFNPALAQEDTSRFSTTTNAEQTTVISGGDSFENAEELDTGSYESGASVPSGEKKYFKVSGFRPGEQVTATGNFEGDTGASLILYDADRSELARESQHASEPSDLEVSWLPGTEKTIYEYYIVIEVSRDGDLSSYSLEIEKVSYFDGGAESDAGNSFEKAVPLTEGTYTGYLVGRGSGTDDADFYSVDVNRGQVLVVTITPPSNASFDAIVFYDSSRKELERHGWPNQGAVVTAPFLAEKSDTYYLEIDYGSQKDEGVLAYDLETSILPLSEAREYFEEDELPTELDTTQRDTNSGIDARDIATKEAAGFLATITEGVNKILLIGVGVGALILGFVLGFATGKLLSSSKKPKATKEPQPKPEDQS
ncbi:MAG: hypothetical protein U9M98_02315 [Patescibacteria group bacterium]|nr:hypothetical protein [Patescibacteria group bacterium]